MFLFPDRTDHPGSPGSGIRGEAGGDPVPSRSTSIQPPPAQRHLRRQDPRAAPELPGVPAQEASVVTVWISRQFAESGGGPGGNRE